MSHPVWPFCESAQNLRSAVLTADGSWDQLDWSSRMEKLAAKGVPVLATGKDGLGTNMWYHKSAAIKP